MTETRSTAATKKPHGRAGWQTGMLAAALCVFVVCLCVIPKADADLYWQVRAGHDIWASGHAPLRDTFSWTRAGTLWVAPEWLSFALLWLAYHAGGFGGIWLLMAFLATLTALTLWAGLRESLTPLAAFALAPLAWIACSDFLQPRPYLFTYLFLPLALGLVLRARRRGRSLLRLWGLVPLCALWANLHQGVLVFAGLLLALAAGDGAEAAWRRRNGDGEDAALAHSARQGAVLAISCALATLATPYGWRFYSNLQATVSSPTAMNLVVEWHPVTSFPIVRVWAFALLAAVVVCAVVFARIPRRWGEMAALALLLEQAIVHARNIPLFALAGALLAAPYVQSCLNRMAPVWQRAAGRDASRLPALLLAAVSLFCVASALRVAVQTVRAAPEQAPVFLEHLGRVAVRADWFPERACQFMRAERFPPHLRMFNSYSIGGYLIEQLPQEPVFIDGREDIYLGPVMDDYIGIEHCAAPSACADTLSRYQFDCVVTNDPPEVRAFAADPQWAVVYTDDRATVPVGYRRCWVLLRQRPEYMELIARCQRDCAALHSGQ